jgi:hypothetical protein
MAFPLRAGFRLHQELGVPSISRWLFCFPEKTAPVHPSVDSPVCLAAKVEDSNIVLLDIFAYFVRVDRHHVLQVLQHYCVHPIPRRRANEGHKSFYPIEVPCEYPNCYFDIRVIIEIEYLPLRR